MLLLLPPALEAQERPETWDMSVEELRAVGLGQSRGAPIPVPDSAPRLNAENDPATGGSYAGVIFVNFDGANLSLAGMDDSRTDTTSNSLLGGAFAAYGEGVKREATMQAVREDWSAFNVLVVECLTSAAGMVDNAYDDGDLSGDGIVDDDDEDLLKFLLHKNARQPTPEELSAGDLNGNGELDNGDRTLLKRLIEGKPLTP